MYIPDGLVGGVGEGPVPRGNASSYYCDIVNFNNMQHRPFGLSEGLGKSPIPRKNACKSVTFKVTNTYQVVFLKGLEKHLYPMENAA